MRFEGFDVLSYSSGVKLLQGQECLIYVILDRQDSC